MWAAQFAQQFRQGPDRFAINVGSHHRWLFHAPQIGDLHWRQRAMGSPLPRLPANPQATGSSRSDWLAGNEAGPGYITV